MTKDFQIILFLPIMSIPWPQRPIEKGQPFPMEYVLWHKQLLKFFSNKKDCHFIWKGMLMANQKFDLAQKIINDNKFDNIEYQRNKFTDWFGKVDKIIFDTPSTAFFESIFSNIPSLALYRPKDQNLRSNAYSEFRNSLKPYSNINEGIEIVSNFINESPENYLPKIKISKKSVLDIVFQNK
mgnify:CR=1 FL=1|tara:strand:- start:518 stop:1063 length:546 start_codon:yes stop_codon:yes gene_type:complete